MIVARVVSVDSDGVTLERLSDRTMHRVSWSTMRECGAPLLPHGSIMGPDHPDDVIIHDTYAPLLREARRLAERAGLGRRVVWSDIGERWLDPDQAVTDEIYPRRIGQ